MPGRDVETPLLVGALADRGVVASIEPWGSDRCLDCRLVVIRSPWDYTERYGEFLTWLRRTAAGVAMVNPADVIEWNSHKGYLLELAAAGVPVVETTVVAEGAAPTVQAAALTGYDLDVVIKPAVSAGARETLRVASGSAEARRHLASLAARGDVLVQPFEATIIDGEVSLIYFGGQFSHAVCKVPAAGDFRVQVRFGGIESQYAPTAAERGVGDAAVTAVGRPLGYARVDLVNTDKGPRLMELELIEPQLFLDRYGEAPARFAGVLHHRLAELPN
jgi:glutathione synthase/RimK-type ligase-like ATP-grasp enzyme